MREWERLSPAACSQNEASAVWEVWEVWVWVCELWLIDSAIIYPSPFFLGELLEHIVFWLPPANALCQAMCMYECLSVSLSVFSSVLTSLSLNAYTHTHCQLGNYRTWKKMRKASSVWCWPVSSETDSRRLSVSGRGVNELSLSLSPIFLLVMKRTTCRSSGVLFVFALREVEWSSGRRRREDKEERRKVVKSGGLHTMPANS